MKTGFSIFIMVAEEMSISAAAKRAFVTQQCVSDHIRRLEREYGVVLFERKPHLRLTVAGETMLSALRNVSILEQNMESNLRGIAQGQRGEFTVGMSTSRAQVLLPRMLDRYHEMFPDVEISFYVNDTVIMEQQLLEGKIDLFLGVNTSQNESFTTMPLADDTMRLIISDRLLRQHFGSRDIHEFEQGADLARFTAVPFALYYTTGAVNKVISRHLEKQRLQLKTNYHISDCDSHITMCASGLCAALCPKGLLHRVSEYNSQPDASRLIHVFPIKYFDETLRLDFVWHKHTTLPLYTRIFMEMLRDEVALLASE